MAINEEKYRRMELRKATGTRTIPSSEEKIDYRAPRYLVAHACFSCRKSFKQSLEDNEDTHICPQCQGEAYCMGRNFRAPKTNDIKQWKKVQILYAEGFRFIGSGRHKEPKLPAKLSEVQQFLNENPSHPLKVAAPNQALQLTSS